MSKKKNKHGLLIEVNITWTKSKLERSHFNTNSIPKRSL